MAGERSPWAGQSRALRHGDRLRFVEGSFRAHLAGHVTGSSAYVAAFLALGATFGPAILEWIHLAALGVRLLWLLPLAVGLPLLIVRWGLHVRSRQPVEPSCRGLLGAVLMGGFIGTVALAATLSATAAVAELFGAAHPLNAAYTLLGWLMLGLELGVGVTVVLLYTILLTLLVGLAAAYYELVLPYLTPHGSRPSRQVFGLALLALGLLGGIFLVSLLVECDGRFDDVWWQAGGPMMLLGIALGVTDYATTAVYGRVLAIAAAPTFRRDA